MSLTKTLSLLGAMLALMFISGCSERPGILKDLFQKDVASNSLESNKFKVNCELNVDDFSLILEEPISESINCLGRNLNRFMDVADSGKPEYLSRVGLENFLKRNRKDIKPEVIKALKTIFEINFLVYGEDKDFISRTNLNALINFALIFNEKSVSNYKYFQTGKSIDYDNYRVQRDQFFKRDSLEISLALKKIFQPNRNGATHKLSLVDLLDSFTTESNAESMANIKKLLFAKKILLGGDEDSITHTELASLIENFSSFMIIGLDLTRYKDIRLNQEATIQLLNNDLDVLNSLVFSSTILGRDNPRDLEKEKLFTIRQAIDGLKQFMDEDDIDLDGYYELIKEAKLILMGEVSPGNDAATVTAGDVKRLFAHGMSLLNTGKWFHRFWIAERALLEARPARAITYDFKKLYTDFEHEITNVDSFVRILKKYRFMKGENLSAYYTDNYVRNADGVFEIAMYEYALKLVMKKFGCPNNTLKGKVVCDTVMTADHAHMGQDYVYMTKDHVIQLVNTFRKVLIDNDLIYPGREEKTAETITLLGSLFQYQSDENKVFDVNEATEFGISLFTSIGISDDVNDHFESLEKQNKCDIDKFGRVSPDCFKAHFFEAVCLNYPDQFPKLFSSLGATVYQRDARGINRLVCKIPQNAPNLAYLDRATLAARTCNTYPDTGEEIYYSKGDMMAIYLAMMHIETTILRWDTRNTNNVMDPEEVMDAYNIYSPALDGFMEGMPSVVKKLKKQIYQYLVKYEKVPDSKDFGSIWKFVRFLVTFDWNATANRKTIASILVTISEQGAVSTFDCNQMHNPDDIRTKFLQAEAASQAASSGAVSETKAPLVLTRRDILIYESIENESDADIKRFLGKTYPELLSLPL